MAHSRQGKINAWLKIARLQFYPMTWIAYSLGCVAAHQDGAPFILSTYVIGYVCLFLIELCTVLSNDYYDYPSDIANENASPFTGGSRMLVEGRINFRDVKIAMFIILLLIFLFGFLLLSAARDIHPFSIITLLLMGIFLGLGYTVPPLKFSYRGLGEVVVGITHSSYVVLCGYIFQSGVWTNTLPWLLSVPLFLATLGAITLAGIPDHRADGSVAKKTIAVLFGPREAAVLSILFISLAAVTGMLLLYFELLKGPVGMIMLLVIPHAIQLWIVILKLIKTDDYDRRIDRIMQSALSYIIWFGLIPLIYFYTSQ
jgi:1,4-dihydroxy-2-naphthoate octaprenyltransferase